jgi:hypothetical protein
LQRKFSKRIILAIISNTIFRRPEALLFYQGVRSNSILPAQKSGSTLILIADSPPGVKNNATSDTTISAAHFGIRRRHPHAEFHARFPGGNNGLPLFDRSFNFAPPGMRLSMD